MYPVELHDIMSSAHKFKVCKQKSNPAQLFCNWRFHPCFGIMKVISDGHDLRFMSYFLRREGFKMMSLAGT